MADPHSDPGLFANTTFWFAISFGIFAYILWKKAKDGFIAMLDKRIHRIRDEIATADKLRAESEALLQEYEAKHRDALHEAEGIVETARTLSKRIQEEAQSSLEDALTRKEAQLSERLERMQQTAIAEIQQYAANLAIEATREIIAAKMDAQASGTLMEQSIKAVAGKVN